MHKNLIVALAICIILSSMPVGAHSNVDRITLKGVEIDDLQIPQEIEPDKPFEVRVEVKSHKCCPTRIWIRIDLLDAIGIGVIAENIGESDFEWLFGKTHTYHINCMIRQEDARFKHYKIRVTLWEVTIGGLLIKEDSITRSIVIFHRESPPPWNTFLIIVAILAIALVAFIILRKKSVK